MYDSYYGSYSSPYYDTYSSGLTSSSADLDGIGGLIGVFAGIGIFMWILIIAAVVLTLVGRWKMFKKAGVDAWESLIPVHANIVEMKLGGVATYWYFLNLIAILGIGPLIVHFWTSIALAKSFGKGTGFGVLLALFPFVCYPILGFGNAQYVGPSNGNTTSTNTGYNNPTQNNYYDASANNNSFNATPVNNDPVNNNPVNNEPANPNPQGPADSNDQYNNF